MKNKVMPVVGVLLAVGFTAAAAGCGESKSLTFAEYMLKEKNAIVNYHEKNLRYDTCEDLTIVTNTSEESFWFSEVYAKASPKSKVELMELQNMKNLDETTQKISIKRVKGDLFVSVEQKDVTLVQYKDVDVDYQIFDYNVGKSVHTYRYDFGVNAKGEYYASYKNVYNYYDSLDSNAQPITSDVSEYYQIYEKDAYVAGIEDLLEEITSYCIDYSFAADVSTSEFIMGDVRQDGKEAVYDIVFSGVSVMNTEKFSENTMKLNKRISGLPISISAVNESKSFDLRGNSEGYRNMGSVEVKKGATINPINLNGYEDSVSLNGFIRPVEIEDVLEGYFY